MYNFGTKMHLFEYSKQFLYVTFCDEIRQSESEFEQIQFLTFYVVLSDIFNGTLIREPHKKLVDWCQRYK